LGCTVPWILDAASCHTQNTGTNLAGATVGCLARCAVNGQQAYFEPNVDDICGYTDQAGVAGSSVTTVVSSTGVGIRNAPSVAIWTTGTDTAWVTISCLSGSAQHSINTDVQASIKDFSPDTH
jgi:hypothetical protein